MKKRIFAGILSLTIALGALSGCGNQAQTEETTSPDITASATAEPETDATTPETVETATSPEARTEATAVAEASNGEVQKIKVAASATPHAEILEAIQPMLAAEGVEMEIITFDDYIQPNLVVDSGDLDANYFQHLPYLENFNTEKGTTLVSVAKVHYEPFGIYPGTKKALSELAEGDTIAVPNDVTNEARALLLLQDNGIIKLKDDAGLNATVNDIVENPKNVQIQELEAAQVARVAPEVAFVVLNGNYALNAGYTVDKDALSYEKTDSEAAKTYVNVLVVKEGNEDNPAIQKLVTALRSEETKKFIADKYAGAVIFFEE